MATIDKMPSNLRAVMPDGRLQDGLTQREMDELQLVALAALDMGKRPTQRDLAAEAGMSLQTIQAAMRGRHCTRATAQAIAKVLGVERELGEILNAANVTRIEVEDLGGQVWTIERVEDEVI